MQDYLNSLHQEEINKYLQSYQNASPEQKQQINQAINPQPTAPPLGSAIATPVNPTDSVQMQGQPGLLSDGQGGFIPAPGTNYGANYGIVSNHNGAIVLNTPQGQMGFGSPEEAQRTAQQLGIPYAPAFPTVGSASPDQLNSFTYGTNSDGTPATSYSASSSKPADSTMDKGALSYLTDLLKKYGLESLAGWAMEQLKSGASQYEIIQALRERPEYKTRFAGMDQRRQNGLGALSEDEYMAWEKTAKDYLQRANIAGYNTPEQLAPLIGTMANVGQLADRVQKGYQQVAEAPPEILQYMESHFGINGRAQLARFMLDPEKALPEIMRDAQTAVIGGYGIRQGLDVSQNAAAGLADMGFTTQQIQSGMAQAGQMGGLQQQTVDEAAAKAAGLSADTLAQGVFGADQVSTMDIKTRLGTRKAQFDSKGTAGTTQKGAFGLGVAQ